jgi:hypothetical protein
MKNKITYFSGACVCLVEREGCEYNVNNFNTSRHHGRREIPIGSAGLGGFFFFLGGVFRSYRNHTAEKIRLHPYLSSAAILHGVYPVESFLRPLSRSLPNVVVVFSEASYRQGSPR